MKASIFLLLCFVCSYSFINGMDILVKQKMVKVDREFKEELRNHGKNCEECQLNFGKKLNWLCNLCNNARLLDSKRLYEIAEIVLDPDNRVDDIAKLNHIWGNRLYGTRKEVISRMIQRGIHPNDIKYQFDNPLYEAVFFKDVEFAKFLIRHGAKPDEITRKMATPEFLVALAKK